MTMTSKAEHEIAHGKMVAAGASEEIWGWGTPAGRSRAARRARLIADSARLKPGLKVLEVGCGTGLFTEKFAAYGATILAVDISGELLAKARERKLPPERVTFLERAFEQCHLDGPFDAVIGSSVLHHLDLAAALAKLFRLLKPGGVFAFAEPNYLNPQVFLERKLRFLPYYSYISADETAFVRWSLAGRLASVGFTGVRIVPFDWMHPALPESVMPWVEKCQGVWEALPLLKEFSGSLLIHAVRPGGPAVNEAQK